MQLSLVIFRILFFLYLYKKRGYLQKTKHQVKFFNIWWVEDDINIIFNLKALIKQLLF